jgi:hypothetical protein
MSDYNEKLERLIDETFTSGVKSEQLRITNQLIALVKVSSSVSNPDWQEGYLTALTMIQKNIEQDNDFWRIEK